MTQGGAGNPRVLSSVGATIRAPRLLACPLLAHAHRNVNGRARELEGLAQAPLDDASVLRVEKAGGEENELGGSGGSLGREQDLGLLASAHGVRVLRDKLTEEGI